MTLSDKAFRLWTGVPVWTSAGRRSNLSNQRYITKTPPWIQVLPPSVVSYLYLPIALRKWLAYGKKGLSRAFSEWVQGMLLFSLNDIPSPSFVLMETLGYGIMQGKLRLSLTSEMDYFSIISSKLPFPSTSLFLPFDSVFFIFSLTYCASSCLAPFFLSTRILNTRPTWTLIFRRESRCGTDFRNWLNCSCNRYRSLH